MRYFLFGFVVAVVTVVPAVIIFLYKKGMKTQKDKNGHQLEELGKLTGELAHEIKNPLSTIKVNLNLVAEELQDANSAESGKIGAEKDIRSFARALRE